MFLSDISVKRPVLAITLNLLLVAFGIIAFDKLSVREYPDVEPPIVSVETDYPGASAAVVETKVTQLMEDRISGIEGIKAVESQSRDGRSSLTIEFNADRDIDAASNDVRERISRILDDLPDEAMPPEIFKVSSNEQVLLWLNLSSTKMNEMELTDFAQRYLVDRVSVLPGVARVLIGNARQPAMRIWLNREALAARNLTVTDVERVLRDENVELPAGRIESLDRDFTVRTARSYNTPEDFAKLALKQGEDGYIVRLGEVARIAVEPEEPRSMMRGNGEPMVGLGIIKQSRANSLEVGRAVRGARAGLQELLPEGTTLHESYDSTVFIEEAIFEVYRTLFIAMALVIVIIFAFLGNWRATIIPAVTVPISLLAAFIILFALDFSVNILTMLALILAIGLVVDDAIVVLENVYRRVENGEPPLLAAYRGTRQVGFAVVATTLVLVAVFIPITFMEGNVGRLFSEFAVTLAGAVLISSFVALTLCPVLCAKLLKRESERPAPSKLVQKLNTSFQRLEQRYRSLLDRSLNNPKLTWLGLTITVVVCGLLLVNLPREFAPPEDRGAFFVIVKAPEGASFSYTAEQMKKVETILLDLHKNGEAPRILVRAPGFGNASSVNNGNGTVVLANWNERERSAFEIMGEIGNKVKTIAGITAFPVMRQALSRGEGQPVQFVLSGTEYEQLAKWRDIVLDKARQNEGLMSLDHDYKETKPQILVAINRERAADLGVSIGTIGRTLESMLGSKRVTTYVKDGEEYQVMIEGNREDYYAPADMTNLYVRSERSNQLIPLSNLVTFTEIADAASLNRYNRLRSITITATLAPGYSLGDALAFLENVVKDELPPEAGIDYKGESLEYKRVGGQIYFIFGLALLVVFLVLAAQFESFVHPVTIMMTVPLAISGALIGLLLTGQTLNLYSQIAIIMLIGLAAKNGILIVEFTNQMRDGGKDFATAIRDASSQRLRPVLMTSLTAAMGAVPLILTGGAGSESRIVVGVVIFFGVTLATVLTLFVVPVVYQFIARKTESAHALERELDAQDSEVADKG